jgi:hypothetical protein
MNHRHFGYNTKLPPKKKNSTSKYGFSGDNYKKKRQPAVLTSKKLVGNRKGPVVQGKFFD